MSTLRWLLAVAIAVGLAAVIGFKTGASRTSAAFVGKSDTVQLFAERGLAAAETGHFEMSYFLLRRAINGMGTNPEECQLVWRAIELLPNSMPTGTAVERINEEFSRGLEQALVSCDSVDHFSQLYALWSAIKKTLHSAAESPDDFRLRPSGNLGRVGAATSESDPGALFDQGIDAWRKNQLDRADFLTRAAMRTQIAQSSADPAIWKRFRSFAEEKRQQPFEQLNQLLVYQESVDAALLGSSNVDDFNKVWAVRDEVLSDVNEARGRLVEKMQKRTDKYAASLSDTDITSALGEFVSVRTDLGPKLALLLATRAFDAVQTGNDKEFSAFTQIAVALSRRAKTKAGALDEKAAELAKQLETGESIEVTTEEGKLGRCEELLQDVQALMDALQQAKLDQWFALAAEDPNQINLLEVEGQLVNLYGKVTRLQQLSYSFWALQRISAAESVENWDSYLGSVDTGLLHPSVGALYSSTFDSRIRQVQDPPIRASLVRSILSGKKIPLTAF